MRYLAALMACALGACTAARTPLPAAPPPRSVSDLAAWRQPPALGAEPRVSLGWDIQQTRLPNGLSINVIARPETAVTAVQLWVPSARDMSTGPVAIMGEALRAGSRSKAGSALVNPRLGLAPINVWTYAAGTNFSWQVLPRASHAAIELLGAFVLRPVFERAEVQIRLQEQLAFIQRHSGGSTHLLNLARSALPDMEIPTPEQDARGLFKLGPKELLTVHRCTMQPKDASLVVVGPVAAAEVIDWATAEFGAWQADPSATDAACKRWRAELRSEAEVKRLAQLEMQIIYGGTFDPLVAMAVPGPPPGSEDYLPFALLSEVVGDRDAGSAQELRHTGATYGIHASLNQQYPQFTLLELFGQVEPESAQAGIRKLVEDIRALSQTLTDRELDEVKRRWRNRFINSFANNEAVASSAVWQLRIGRSPEALKSFPNELLQVSVERCREVAKRWLDDAQPSIAVAGIPVKLVRGLGLGARISESYWTKELQEKKKL